MTYFIDYQLDVIIKAMERFGAHVKNKFKETEKANESLSNSPFYPQLKFQHVTILKKGLQNPGRIFTVSELEKDFNVSATAARGCLNALVKMKLLLKTKEGKTFLFIAPSDLRQKLGI